MKLRRQHIQITSKYCLTCFAATYLLSPLTASLAWLIREEHAVVFPSSRIPRPPPPHPPPDSLEQRITELYRLRMSFFTSWTIVQHNYTRCNSSTRVVTLVRYLYVTCHRNGQLSLRIVACSCVRVDAIGAIRLLQ